MSAVLMQGRRSTKQRRLVLQTVKDRRDHPSADQVYLSVRGEQPKISRGTVYRNLNLLAESKDVRQVKMPGMDRFDWRTEPHYHLLCTRCGKLSDAPTPYREALDRQLAEETGYAGLVHTTVFEGVCPDCLKDEKGAGK